MYRTDQAFVQHVKLVWLLVADVASTHGGSMLATVTDCAGGGAFATMARCQSDSIDLSLLRLYDLVRSYVVERECASSGKSLPVIHYGVL